MLAGKTNSVKSWLVLHAAMWRCASCHTLGGRSLSSEGRVLYFALRGHPATFALQIRMTKLLGLQEWT